MGYSHTVLGYETDGDNYGYCRLRLIAEASFIELAKRAAAT